ncbi:LytR family transcriptional regulator, partial [Streptomyces sp. IF17]|nr:LytR family transcriptional regulator [Streptomyces alkaliphilus]
MNNWPDGWTDDGRGRAGRGGPPHPEQARVMPHVRGSVPRQSRGGYGGYDGHTDDGYGRAGYRDDGYDDRYDNRYDDRGHGGRGGYDDGYDGYDDGYRGR